MCGKWPAAAAHHLPPPTSPLARGTEADTNTNKYLYLYSNFGISPKKRIYLYLLYLFNLGICFICYLLYLISLGICFIYSHICTFLSKKSQKKAQKTQKFSNKNCICIFGGIFALSVICFICSVYVFALSVICFICWTL